MLKSDLSTGLPVISVLFSLQNGKLSYIVITCQDDVHLCADLFNNKIGNTLFACAKWGKPTKWIAYWALDLRSLVCIPDQASVLGGPLIVSPSLWCMGLQSESLLMMHPERH